MTTEYTTYACTACKKQLSMAELMNHTCQITEDRVRSLIAEAITEKEEHVRRVVREEAAKAHVVNFNDWYNGVVRESKLKSGDPERMMQQARDEALEEAASVSNGYVYEPCCFAAVESMSKRIRSLKHARPDQARQGEEALHKAPNLGPDLGDRTERPSPASSLRKFIEAADTLKERLLIVAPGSFTERYDTARSRIDVEKPVAQHPNDPQVQAILGTAERAINKARLEKIATEVLAGLCSGQPCHEDQWIYDAGRAVAAARALIAELDKEEK